jgi:hypothetical protein
MLHEFNELRKDMREVLQRVIGAFNALKRRTYAMNASTRQKLDALQSAFETEKQRAQSIIDALTTQVTGLRDQVVKQNQRISELQSQSDAEVDKAIDDLTSSVNGAFVDETGSGATTGTTGNVSGTPPTGDAAGDAAGSTDAHAVDQDAPHIPPVPGDIAGLANPA